MCRIDLFQFISVIQTIKKYNTGNRINIEEQIELLNKIIYGQFSSQFIFSYVCLPLTHPLSKEQ